MTDIAFNVASIENISDSILNQHGDEAEAWATAQLKIKHPDADMEDLTKDQSEEMWTLIGTWHLAFVKRMVEFIEER